MLATNKRAFKALIKRYQSITIEEVKLIYYFKSLTLTKRELTGFGRTDTCTLCAAVKNDCKKCVYCKDYSLEAKNYCAYGENYETYKAIEEANRPEKIIKAYKQRAEHMKKLL